MNVLLTGARGFIGTHTKTALLDRGYSVRSIDRKKQHTRFMSADGEDITDIDFMDAIFGAMRPDCVIHLAANSSLQKSVTNAVYDAQNNIIGTIVILAMCQRYNVKKIVFSSTTAVYSQDAKMPLHEGSLTDPIIPYGVSKLACENYIKASGVPYTILRYGNVYGPGQRPLGESVLIARCLAYIYQNEPFKINGDGSKTRDYVYVEDVVDANIKAMHYKADDTFLIGTGNSQSVRKICRTLAELAGKMPIFDYGPNKPGELQEVKFDIMKAYNQLVWRAKTDIRAGLQKTVDAWPKQEANIQSSAKYEQW